MALAAILLATSAQLSDVALLDQGLAGIKTLVMGNALSAVAEEAAVRRVLQGDEGLLLLTKHFAGMPSYNNLLHAALGLPPPSPPDRAPAIDLLVTRRSLKPEQYDNTRAVPEAIVRRALSAAVLAPNHFLTEPWRFYWLGHDTRAALIQLNADQQKQAAFSRVPGWMLVTVAASADTLGTKKGLEDHAATACAVQNFMLSLTGDGVGSKWMTGALGIAPDALLNAVGANATTEHFMGVVWFGYPLEPLESISAPPRKQGVDGVLKILS